MTENLIILAAGMSSRMKKSVQTEYLSSEELQQANKESKGLISLGSAGRPLLDYILYNAYAAGIRKVYLVTGEANSSFKQCYGLKNKNNTYHGMQLSYAIQHIPTHREKPLGTADAIFQTLEQYPHLKSQQFLVCNSDNLYSEKAFKIVSDAAAANALVAYSVAGLQFSEERLRDFAILKFNSQNYLINIVEKPSQKELTIDTAKQCGLSVSMNIFKFDGSLFYSYVRDCPLHPIRNEKELPVALLNMIEEHPNTVLGIPLKEHVPDLTSKADIPLLKNYIENFDLSLWK